MKRIQTDEELVLSREQVRAVDRIAIDEFGIQGVVLMENAGKGCAEILIRKGITGPVTICCGKGNNGGDGFVIARHLENRGIPVHVLLLAAPHEITPDASENLRILLNMHVDVAALTLPQQLQQFSDTVSRAEWIVDALLGTGTSGEIRDPFHSAIEEINRSGKPVLSIDLPSGMDCDTGQPLGTCVRAAETATFVGHKQGFLNPDARSFLGEVHVIDIGAPWQAIQRAVE